MSKKSTQNYLAPALVIGAAGLCTYFYMSNYHSDIVDFYKNKVHNYFNSLFKNNNDDLSCNDNTPFDIDKITLDIAKEIIANMQSYVIKLKEFEKEAIKYLEENNNLTNQETYDYIIHSAPENPLKKYKYTSSELNEIFKKFGDEVSLEEAISNIFYSSPDIMNHESYDDILAYEKLLEIETTKLKSLISLKKDLENTINQETREPDVDSIFLQIKSFFEIKKKFNVTSDDIEKASYFHKYKIESDSAFIDISEKIQQIFDDFESK